MRLLIGLFSLALFHVVNAQGYLPSGGRAISMANAVVSIEDEFAFFNNPATASRFKSIKAGLAYENRFLLKELQSQSLAAAIPFGKGVMTLGGHHYGYTQFRSYRAGIGYSMGFSEKFSMGVQLNYLGLMLNQNYGSSSALTADAGWFAEITPKWNIGLSVMNIGRAGLSDYENDRYSTAMRLGTSYRFSDRVLISIEGDKDLDNPLRFRGGIEYGISEDFFLRGGLATNRLEMSFGMGYCFSVLRIDIGSSYDQILGWSPNFSIVFINKDTK